MGEKKRRVECYQHIRGGCGREMRWECCGSQAVEHTPFCYQKLFPFQRTCI